MCTRSLYTKITKMYPDVSFDLAIKKYQHETGKIIGEYSTLYHGSDMGPDNEYTEYDMNDIESVKQDVAEFFNGHDPNYLKVFDDFIGATCDLPGELQHSYRSHCGCCMCTCVNRHVVAPKFGPHQNSMRQRLHCPCGDWSWYARFIPSDIASKVIPLCRGKRGTVGAAPQN